MWHFLVIKKQTNEGEGEVVLSSFIGRSPGALVHGAVADPAAQHHAEDHLEDLRKKRKLSGLRHNITSLQHLRFPLGDSIHALAPPKRLLIITETLFDTRRWDGRL